MKINKNELKQALAIVKPGLANKEIIEQSTSFAFLADKVVTYNDEISISHPVTNMNLTGAIKADELFALLNKLKADELDLVISEKEIQITCGKAKAGLILHQDIKLPIQEIGEIKGWQKLPEKFLHHLEFCANVCSKDMSRMVLTCVHIRGDEGIIEASDGFRIAQTTGNDLKKFGKVLIPADSVMQAIKIKPIKIAKSDGWVHFQNEAGTILSSRVLEDLYVNPDKYLSNFKGKELQLPKTLNELMERAGVFAKRDLQVDEAVLLEIGNKKLKIKSESSSGWYEETANMRYDDEPITIAVTPFLLKDILSTETICTLGANALVFGGEDWKYLAQLRNNTK